MAAAEWEAELEADLEVEEDEEAEDAGGAPEAALSSFDQEGGCD